MIKLLLVEDEISLATAIQKFLKTEGYEVDLAHTQEEAFLKIKQNAYKICMIDINLPDGNGNSIIGFAKNINQDAGIIVISANNMTKDKVKSLDLGADDYLTKPFDLQELNARIRSLIRRKTNEQSDKIIFMEITLLPDDFRVLVNQNEVFLTKKEFELLAYFIVNKNRIITKETLAYHLWGNSLNGFYSYDFIYTHVKNLRKKLIKAGAKDYITNVHGIGYKLNES